jgi:hypothetical protein
MLKTVLLQKKYMFICFQFTFICLHLTCFFSSWTCREGTKREGYRGASPFIHNLDDAKACMLNATSRPLYPRQRGMVPIFLKGGCVSRPVLADAENLAHSGVQTAELQTRNESHLTYTNTYFSLLSYDASVLAKIPKCQFSSFIGLYAT